MKNGVSETLKEWIEEGIKNKNKYLIVVCDTFDQEEYPIFCKDDKEFSFQKEEHNKNMQRVVTIINLSTGNVQ